MGRITKNFEICPSHADEAGITAATEEELVSRIAYVKGKSVFECHPQSAVISADTMVFSDGERLGKPSDAADAKRMLHKLSGKTHTVMTAVWLFYGAREQTLLEKTEVTFRPLSEEEINRYVESGAPMDKAGAYGIQECDFVQKIDGDYDNVVGLPVNGLNELLKTAEVL